MRLVVEEIDPETNCIDSHASLEIGNISELSALIDFGGAPDFDKHGYSLSAEDIALLKAAYGLEGVTGTRPGYIHSWPKIYDLPYTVHTNRELKFMLAGTKPFAFFSYWKSEQGEFRDFIEKPFRPHVEAGRIHLTEHRPADSPESLYAFYTLPGEEWRVQAFIDLQASAGGKGWTDEMIREEGRLLGYEEWQNDAFLAMFPRETGLQD